MKVRIIKDRFGGMGWRAEPGVLHLGGVGTAGVESLSFALPEEWSGMAVTLHIEQEGGTLPQPVLLDESRTVTVDHRFTTARQGLWMLLAQSADGYTAMSCPAKYDCYETIGLSGTVEDVDPSVYAQFVALVQQAVNTAMNEGAAAKDAAKTAQAAMDAAQKGAAATQKERMSAEDAESAAALAAARTQADITAAAASAASALGAAAETLDACTAATQAANRAANLAPKKEERRLLMRLLQEAAYQTKTADTLLDQLSGVWAEVPVGAVTLTRDSLTLYAGAGSAGSPDQPRECNGADRAVGEQRRGCGRCGGRRHHGKDPRRSADHGPGGRMQRRVRRAGEADSGAGEPERRRPDPDGG